MPEEKNSHEGHRKRMRDRYKISGFNGWDDREILEFILFDMIPRRDTRVIARELLDKFGTIENVFSAEVKQLCQIKGIGKKTAEYVRNQEKIFNLCKVIRKNNVNKKYDISMFDEIFAYKKNEGMYMICLDAKNRIIREGWMFEGKLGSVSFDVGVLVRRAVLCEAHRIVVAHNHPSGSCFPSESDILATKIITKAMWMIGVEVMDHVIVCDTNMHSMKENGEM